MYNFYDIKEKAIKCNSLQHFKDIYTDEYKYANENNFLVELSNIICEKELFIL